jgi:putative nucleotidyltransferase with HDIG domain
MVQAFLTDLPAPVAGGLGVDLEFLKIGEVALSSVHAFASRGDERARAGLADGANAVADSLADMGVERWMRGVRKHHSQTYQHCLLVTGLSVAFARHLGFSERDIARVSLGGLLHDLGKARIPLEILEKPTPLNEAEADVMRTHATLGREILAAHGGYGSDMLAIVGDHHEYLDGTGYPRQLNGHEIGEQVRLVTITDIFAALIEQRSYKPALSGPEAYAYLCSLEDKLDRAFVRAFEPVALQVGALAA